MVTLKILLRTFPAAAALKTYLKEENLWEYFQDALKEH